MTINERQLLIEAGSKSFLNNSVNVRTLKPVLNELIALLEVQGKKLERFLCFTKVPYLQSKFLGPQKFTETGNCSMLKLFLLRYSKLGWHC